MDIYAVSIQKYNHNGYIGDFNILDLLWFGESYEFQPTIDMGNGYRQVAIKVHDIDIPNFYNWFKVTLNNRFIHEQQNFITKYTFVVKYRGLIHTYKTDYHLYNLLDNIVNNINNNTTVHRFFPCAKTLRITGSKL